jgi:hypothetical protein
MSARSSHFCMVLICNPCSLFSDGITDDGQAAEVFIIDSLASPIRDSDADAEPAEACKSASNDTLAIRHSGWRTVKRYGSSSRHTVYVRRRVPAVVDCADQHIPAKQDQLLLSARRWLARTSGGATQAASSRSSGATRTPPVHVVTVCPLVRGRCSVSSGCLLTIRLLPQAATQQHNGSDCGFFLVHYLIAFLACVKSGRATEVSIS